MVSSSFLRRNHDGTISFVHVYRAAKADGGVIGMRLYVERDNQRAHQTYERLGMAWTTYWMMERYPL
jgi:hypothetical protein